ncbi:MAG: HPr family phosphocarrier protein [Oscillospiraceae bacterium]
MQEFKINLSTIQNVKEFVNTVSRFDFDVDLVSGRYSVDAKSIMGIFSLELSKPLTMRIMSTDCDEFISLIQKFIVE